MLKMYKGRPRLAKCSFGLLRRRKTSLSEKYNRLGQRTELSQIFVVLYRSRSVHLSADGGCLASPHSVSVARVAVLTWRALAQCLGFTVEENSVFWRRVFSFLTGAGEADPNASPSTKAVAVSEAVRFFGEDDAVFPRIMVAVHGLGDAGQVGDTAVERIRGLCGLSELNEGDATTRATFDQLMATLAPFHEDPLPTHQLVDVCLDVSLGPTSLSTLLTRLRRLLEDASRTPSSSLRICRIQFSGTLVVRDATHVELLERFLRDDDLCPLADLSIAPPKALPQDHARRFLRAIIGATGRAPTSSPRALSIERAAWANQAYASLMSALPFSTTVHSLRLHVHGDATQAETHDLPWLAYALFHPRTPQSGWRHLELRNLAPRARTGEIFQAMARGNNLLALLVRAPADCTVLPEGTPIQRQPKHDTATLLVTDQGTGEVDLCVTSPDASAWSEWVAVVVAGAGLGWVRSYAVRDVVTRAPAALPSLAGLRVAPRWGDAALGDYAAGTLVHVLRALGASLTYLHVAEFGDIRSSTVLFLLTSLCPNVATLVCTNDGSLLITPSPQAPDGDAIASTHRTASPLRELELRLKQSASRLYPPGQRALRSWLGNLRALRVVSTTSPSASSSSAAANRDAVRTALTELEWLQYLHWDTTRRTQPIAISTQQVSQPHRDRATAAAHPPSQLVPATRYDAQREVTSLALSRLQLPPRVLAFAQGATSPRAVSALHRVAQRHAVNENRTPATRTTVRWLLQLDENVLATIFAFTTTAVPRELCVAAEWRAWR